MYEENGVIHIVGSGEREFEAPPPDSYEYIRRRAVFWAKKFDIPERLFLNLIKAESNFNPEAVSRKGAKGLCQLMPDTARELGVKNIFDIDENLSAGAKYLKRLYDRYGDWKLAIAAYNAGPGAVDRYGSVPPYSETVSYVRKVYTDVGNSRIAGEKGSEKYRIVVKRVGNTIMIYQEFLEE